MFKSWYDCIFTKSKLNNFIVNYISIIELCLFNMDKYAVFFCVLVLFYLLKEKHCRSPPIHSIQKKKLNGGRINAIFSRYLYIRIYRKWK